MADKAGDRFTDRMGRTYELRADPQGGHLRPYTVRGANTGNALAAIIAAVVAPVVVGGLGWIWNKLTHRKK